MRKLLPIILAATVYLTPLYPVYAQPVGPSLQRGPDARALKEGTAGGTMTPPGLNVALGRVKNATAEARLKQALARFKDKNKANRVGNISENLNAINERRTANMQLVLDKIAGVLERLKNKAGETAIAEAETEWAEADAAVKAQSEKDYTIVVNAETTAASDAATARNSLRTDLKRAHTQVVEARQALARAIATALSSIKGGNNGSD